MVVAFFQAFSAPPGHEPDVIEEQEWESNVGPFKVAPIKAYRAVNDYTSNYCQQNYVKDLFHVCSTKDKARFWRAVGKKSIRSLGKTLEKDFHVCSARSRMGLKPASCCDKAVE